MRLPWENNGGNMRVGVYSGSFDPITLGHQDVIKRAAKMFDKLIVVVGNNSEKKYWFSLEERTEMVKELQYRDRFIFRSFSKLSYRKRSKHNCKRCKKSRGLCFRTLFCRWKLYYI